MKPQFSVDPVFVCVFPQLVFRCFDFSEASLFSIVAEPWN